MVTDASGVSGVSRLTDEFLNRIECFCDRVVDVVDALADQNRPRRMTEQLAACGTSVGANAFEAAEALSRADFCKTLGIMIKELNETRFWLRLVARRNWIPEPSLIPLLTEAEELKKILGAMLARTRAGTDRLAACNGTSSSRLT